MLRFVVWLFLCVWLAGCTTPKALTEADLKDQAKLFQSRWQEGEKRLAAPMTLADALVYALNHNLQFRLDAYQAAMASGNRKMATLSMLPSLTAEAGYSKRNNMLASTSRSVATGNVSLIPSTSSDPSDHTLQLQASWNLLDFAFGWLDAKNFGEQALASQEAHRRVTYQLTVAVVQAWDQAYALQEIKPQLEQAKVWVAQALSQSTQVQQRGLQDQMELIEYRKSLLLISQRINQLYQQMAQADDQLAQLLGLPAGVHIKQQALPDDYGLLRQGFANQLEVWQWAALLHRPEVREAIYKQRSVDHQTVRQLVALFPRLMLGYGLNRDSNSYLVNDSWRTTSASLALDVMKLVQLPMQHRVGKINKSIAAAQTQLQATAVMAQVDMADKVWQSARADSCISDQLSHLDQNKLDILQARVMAATGDKLTVIQAQLDALLLHMQALLAQAQLRQASLLLAQSVGVGALPDKIEGSSPTEQAASIAKWLQGGMQQHLESVFVEARKALDNEQGVAPTAAAKTAQAKTNVATKDGMIPLDLEAQDKAANAKAAAEAPPQLSPVASVAGNDQESASCVFSF